MAKATKTTKTTPEAVVEVAETPEVVEYDMGEFKIGTFLERNYQRIYFGCRELYGLEAKKDFERRKGEGESFNWNVFNEQWKEVFGDKDEVTRFTVEEWAEFAMTNFNKSLEQVIQYNINSMNKKKERDEKYGNSNNPAPTQYSNQQIISDEDDDYPPY